MNPKKVYTINSRKFDRSIQRSWQCELIETNIDLYVLRGVFEKEVNHPHIGVIRRGTISTEYFWLQRWYNVFRFEHPDGKPLGFYCNVNLPPNIGDSTLDYIDLDLDIFVDADFNFRLLDSEDFEINQKKYGYGREIIRNAENAVKEIEFLIENRHFPFDTIL